MKKAMQDLRPDLLATYDENISNEQLIELCKAHLDTPFRGIWQCDNEDLEYYIHGAGCRLTNLQTSEVIEWAAPNLDEFYVVWFLNWLRWYVSKNEMLDELVMFAHSDEDIVARHLLDLENSASLMQFSPKHYRVLVKDI